MRAVEKPCQGITFLMVLAGTQKGVCGKGNEGRHTTPFPLAQRAQEIVKWVALVQTLRESRSLFCLFPIAVRVVEPNQPIW